MESDLDKIETGSRDAAEVWETFLNYFRELHDNALKKKKEFPTKRQIQFYERLASLVSSERLEEMLQGNDPLKYNSETMGELIDSLMKETEGMSLPPTAKQVSFIKSLAENLEMNESQACELVSISSFEELSGGKSGSASTLIGKLKDSYIFASETCALDIIGAKYIRDVENGEIVYVENKKLISLKPFPLKKIRPCVFEYIYFSRPDSILNGKCAYEYRKNFGVELAKETSIDADLVVPVPDSGNAAAIGYSQYEKINFDLGLIRNHYVGRTFIEPTQNIRSLGVKLKLSSTKSIVKNKSIILIDDSLVRGTTCNKIVKMLYESGAKEVHVRIACPEIKYPDFYGVDMPTKEELLAHKKNIREMCNHIGAKSLEFLSLTGLYTALKGEKRNSNYPQFSDHYFTGDYPIKPHDNLANIRSKQLSLLSGKSNN